eukprot:SAG31_NODE_1609_length_7753_cov_12.390253_1_plen_117_part_10
MAYASSTVVLKVCSIRSRIAGARAAEQERMNRMCGGGFLHSGAPHKDSYVTSGRRRRNGLMGTEWTTKEEARSKKQEARTKKQERRSKKQEARSKKQEARSKKQEARSKKQEARSKK